MKNTWAFLVGHTPNSIEALHHTAHTLKIETMLPCVAPWAENQFASMRC